MTRQHNPFLIAAVLVTLALYLGSTKDLLGTGVAGLGLLATLFTRGGTLDAIGQVILALFSAVCAYLASFVFGVAGKTPPPGDIGPVGTVLALWFLFATITRLFLAAPRGGTASTAGILMLSVLSMGEISHGRRYPVMAIATLLLLILAMRFGDAGRQRWRSVPFRERRRTITVLLISTLIASLLMIYLPVLFKWGVKRMTERYWQTAIGFNQTFELGSLKGVLQSDEVVLRVRGKKTDYLRGVVYTRYLNGIWLEAKEGELKERRFPRLEGSPFETSITPVGSARDRYFLPKEAVHIRITGDAARVGKGGILLPPEDQDAQTARFDSPGAGKPDIPQPPPEDDLLRVPALLTPLLTHTAKRWTRDAPDDFAKLRILETRLKTDFRYSLDFEREEGPDPLRQFLTTDRQGHCEYFAASMALLARTLDIPTRVVGGYRVREWNPIGKYHVVREKNAHAWVEAWTGKGGWRTYDPTPASELFASHDAESPLLVALIDVAGERLRALATRITEMTAGEMITAIGLLLTVWVALITVRRLRNASRKRRRDGPLYTAPPEAMSRLIAALSITGHPRPPHEPMDRFVERVARARGFEAAGPTLVRVLERYNGWRFGGIGDPVKISREIDTWIATALFGAVPPSE